MTIAKLTMAM